MFRKTLLASSLCAAILLCASKAAAQKNKVIVWGVQTNSPEWNRALGVSGTRQGCSSPPQGCIRLANDLAHKYHVKVFLSILLNSNAPAYAIEYSESSRKVPALVEVGIDDFLAAYRKLSASSSDPASIVNETIDNLKSRNPNLKFGGSVYEDELNNPILRDQLPASIRAKFDYVHFYLHYRKNGPKYDKYIPEVKKLFPNAGIIAGVYAYDRRHYLPCAQGGSKECSSEEELDLFQKTMAIETRLLQDGTAEWLEFYPGNFGKVDEWKGWENPRMCGPGDRDNCIHVTRQLHEAAIRGLGGQSPNE